MWTYFSKWIIFKWSITTILCHLGATITTIMYHVCIIAMGGTGGMVCIRVFQMKFEKSVSMQNLDKKPLSLWAKDNETLNFPTRKSSPPFTNTANMQSSASYWHWLIRVEGKNVEPIPPYELYYERSLLENAPNYLVGGVVQKRWVT